MVSEETFSDIKGPDLHERRECLATSASITGKKEYPLTPFIPSEKRVYMYTPTLEVSNDDRVYFHPSQH